MKRLLLSLPVQYKLMLANWMVIIVPFIFVALLVPVLWLGVMKVDLNVQRQVASLLPSPINGMIVQNSTRILYKDLSKPKKDLDDFYWHIRLLEIEGMNIVLMQDNTVLYMTPTAQVEPILAKGKAYGLNGAKEGTVKDGDFKGTDIEKYPKESSKARKGGLGSDKDAYHSHTMRKLDWNGDEVTYVVENPRAWSLYGYGQAPFLGRVLGDSDEKDAVEDVIVGALVAFGVLILLFGAYMGYRVSRWIVLPLQQLQEAARHIQDGDLTKEVEPVYADELGATCLSFDMMRRELLYQRNKQQQMEQQRREMIGGICHDLATPLTSISGFAQGLRDGVAITEEKKKHYLDIIIKQSQILERLVERLSDFSRFELGHLATHNEVLSISDFTIDWVKGYVGSHTDIPITVHIDRPDSDVNSTQDFVSFDPSQFTRVLMNVVENSIKYKKGDHVTIDLKVESLASKVRIFLGDRGMGVEEKDVDSLFEIFYRSDSARSDVKNGSGIGLAVVKQIIESIGGTVRAARNEYGGLTIIMEFKKTEPARKGESI